jgi:hypothetical protein
MGKLMYTFRIAITFLAIILFFWIFYGGLGDLFLGFFRFGGNNIYIDPANGAIFNPNTNTLKLIISQKEINKASALEIIFYNEDGSSNQLHWSGSLDKNKNILYFDMTNCLNLRTDILAVSLIDKNIKSFTTNRINIKDGDFSNEGIVYNLCSQCISQGRGTKDNPIIICNCDELENITSILTNNYALGNNIDCSEKTNFNPIGDDIKPFRGTLNGQGYYIYNLKINQNKDYVGLIGVLYRGKISNIGLVSGSINGNLFVAPLVGRQEKGEIEKSYVKDFEIFGKANTAGLVGASNGEISNCYSISNITASIFGGGLVGSFEGELTNSYFSGKIDSIHSGFVGKSVEGYTITNSYYNKDLLPNPTNVIGFAKTTEQLKTKENYQSWDFEKTWSIQENKAYPHLIY